MKRRIILAVIMVMCMVFMTTACGKSGGGDTNGSSAGDTGSTAPAAGTQPADVGEPVEIRLATAFTTGSTGYQMYEDFGAKLSELSDGNMTVKQFANSSILDPPSMLDGILDGVADAGQLVSSFAAGVISEYNALAIPGYYYGDDWLGFADALHEPLEAVLNKYDLHLIAVDYQSHSTFVSTKKQIETPADCKGLLLRSSGTWLGKAIETWGGSATTMAIPDVPTGLERGTIDGLYCGDSMAVDIGLYEIADYITLTTISETFSATAMNLDVYNSLSDQQKQWLDEAGKFYEQERMEAYEAEFPEKLKKMEEHGNSIVTLDKTQSAVFTEPLKPLFVEFSSDTTAEGLALAKVIFEQNGWDVSQLG
jgi:C4-dicarboxylate transporter DctM subunit